MVDCDLVFNFHDIFHFGIGSFAKPAMEVCKIKSLFLTPACILPYENYPSVWWRGFLPVFSFCFWATHVEHLYSSSKLSDPDISPLFLDLLSHPSHLCFGKLTVLWMRHVWGIACSSVSLSMWSSTCWALHLAIVTVLSIIVVGNIIVIIVLIMIISIALIINALLLFRLDHCSEEGEHILPLKFAQDRLFIVVLILSSSTGKWGHSHLFAFLDLIDRSFYAEPKCPWKTGQSLTFF